MGSYPPIDTRRSRAQELRDTHHSIVTARQNTAVRTLEKKWEIGDESLAHEQGQETFCAHLAEMSKRTGIPTLDEKPTVWQTNWVFPKIESGTMLTENGDRLWLRVTLEDLTGQTSVTMNEKIALSLSGRANKDEFLQAVEDGDPIFPSIVSAKVVRKLKTTTRDEATEAQCFVNNNVVEISPQDMDKPRTATCLTLIGMLRASATLSDAILPASLSMMLPSKLYPLLVQYPVSDIPPQSCRKIWVLIKATKKSKCTEQPPFQVTTDDVEDVLDAAERETASEKTKKPYKMISMCNKNNRASLMLTPSHGKHVYAVAIITGIHGDTLFAENVEALQRDEKDQLAQAIRQEMTVAIRLLEHTINGKTTSWNDATSPMAARKCRVLGKSPTGPELDGLQINTYKKARIE